MLTLRQIFDTKLTLKSDKWEPYFDVYETYFSRFRNNNPTFIEVGVQGGGCMELWREYFGSGARIFGIDINPEVREVPGTEIIIGDQSNREFWEKTLPRIGEIDCFIDDGGHTATQHNVTFEMVWPMIKQGGIYVCEDTHTSYWGEFGGGYKREGTFVEFAKKCADMLHIDHIRDPAAKKEISTLPENLLQVSFFNSQVILVKGKPAFNRLMVNVR